MASKKKLAARREKIIKKSAKNQFLATNSKRMKENPTEAEYTFRKILEEKGVSFQEQVPFNKKGHKYILDFIVQGKWVVEIDGGYHLTKEQEEKDRIRDSVLEKVGFKVKRFTNEEVLGYSTKLHGWLNGICGAYRIKNKKISKSEIRAKIKSDQLDREFMAICDF